MRRVAVWTVYLMIFACTASAQPAKLSIRAASAESVEGWQRMQVEHSDRIVWVSPIEAVVGSDIAEAHPEVRSHGDTVIKVVFTDAGASKLRNLTAAQMKKPIALVVEGKVVWAPYVQAETGKESVPTGNTGHGLSQDEVERIMAILRD